MGKLTDMESDLVKLIQKYVGIPKFFVYKSIAVKAETNEPIEITLTLYMGNINE